MAPAAAITPAPTRCTVADLCDLYRDHHAVAPTHRDGKLIAGQKSWKTTRGHLDRIRRVLGPIALDDLSREDT